MVQNDYRYTICHFRSDGTTLGESAVDVDWEPAAESCRFLGIRQGKLSPAAVATHTAIEPRWHPTAGQPCVHSLQVMVTQDDGRQVCCEVPTSYFAPMARAMSAELVEKGMLRDGEFFRYLVGAYPNGQDKRGNAPTASFGIEEVSPSLPLTQSCLADFARRSVRFGQADYQGDIPVFVPQEILDETAALSRKAGALETGGILIGHVHQDSALPEIFLEVTAQVPARHSRCELMRLTFTADTWSAVSASIKLRKKGEIMLGWWHSHSYLKQEMADPPENGNTDKPVKAVNHGEAAFLSAEDLCLHRTCFPRAYSIALVVAEGRCTGLTWALFGWNGGMIGPRSFQVLPGADWLANEPVSIAVGEDAHAQ